MSNAHPNNNSSDSKLLENSLASLNHSNELLIKRQHELENSLAKQMQLCERLKKRIREISAKAQSTAASNQALLRQLPELTTKIDKAHEKIFNTAFTAGIVNRAINEMISSKSYNWTNFFRYMKRTLFSWSFQGKVHFFRTVCRKIFLHKKMQLPSALAGVDRELALLTAALNELCAELNLSDLSMPAITNSNTPGEQPFVVPAFEAVTQWNQIFDVREAKSNSKLVIITTLLFYDANGKKYMHGGAERYVVELSGILKEMGYEPVVVQVGNSDWELNHKTPYGDLPVVGLQSELLFESFSNVLNEYVHRTPCALVIYSPFLIASPFSAINAIGISHGIFWDDWHYHLNLETALFHQRNIRQAFANCHDIVSVDTNTINWFRTITNDAEVNMTYIPNFVDKKEFFPPAKPRSGEKVRIVYPRRLYSARGFDLVLEAFPRLFERFPNIELELIGQIDDSVAQALKRFLAAYKGRVSHRCCQPEDMPEVYRRADIALVPTCYSEGTSLSCLEAMASGCAVIATNVGGLPELVINGYNGLLISPDAIELENAISRLLEDAALRKKLGECAIATSDCYELQIWRQAWQKILNEKLGASKKSAVEFVQLAAPGMTWNAMKQRPQQLFQALAQKGYDSTYLSDEPEVNQMLIKDIPAKLHIKPSTFIPQLNNKYLYLYFPNIIYHRNFSYGDLIKHSDCKIIFDILDDPSIHTNPETGKPDQVFMDNFNLLLNKADFVITSAKELYNKYSKVRPDMQLVFNGVNIEDFALKNQPKRPDDLPDNGKKIVGYYGALAQWVDFDLIYESAKALPEFDFVLIGMNGNEEQIARVTALDNVHFLGIKHYDVLANYLWYFDVATIPFKINPITNAASPIKLFEYCASGTPVVTTGFSEVKQYEEKGIFIGSSHKDYIEKLRTAALMSGNDLDKMKDKLQKIAVDNTWAKRATVIVDMVEKAKAEAEKISVNKKDIADV